MTHPAHRKVREAVASGRLQRPASCERCGAARKLHAHHDDYRKPLDVRWLCPACHKLLHGDLRFKPSDNPNIPPVAINLRRALDDANMTIEELVKRSGFCRGTINKWRTERSIPTYDNLKRVAQVLGKPGVAWFYVDREERKAA